MAGSNTGSRVITMADLQGVGQLPKLTLRLKNPRDKETTNWFRGFSKMLVKAPEEVKLEESSSPEALERNKERVKILFAGFRKQFDILEEDTLNELPTLSEDQQEQLITFWENAGVFLKDILDWLKLTFQRVVELIKEGCRKIKELLEELFGKVREMLNNLVDKDE